MDMKRILQALDGVATQPVVGVNDMSKFLSIVDNNTKSSIITEGKDPHKVSLPVQMAMQHYQKESSPFVERTPSLLGKFFHEVEQEQIAEQTQRRKLINQYASVIAERVTMSEGKKKTLKNSNPCWTGYHPVGTKKKNGKTVPNCVPTNENEIPGHSTGFTGGVGPGMGNYVVDESPLDFDKENPTASTIHSHQGVNPASIEARIMRARGQLRELTQKAESNDLIVWESISRHFPELAMNIEQIRHGIEELAKIRKGGGRRVHNIPSNIGEDVLPTPKTIKPKKKTSVCRAGQVQTGMQTKNGKLVPKCTVK